jgi:hypothetical protein
MLIGIQTGLFVIQQPDRGRKDEIKDEFGPPIGGQDELFLMGDLYSVEIDLGKFVYPVELVIIYRKPFFMAMKGDGEMYLPGPMGKGLYRPPFLNGYVDANLAGVTADFFYQD